MKYIVALAALTAAVSAQNPPGCKSDFDGYFVIKPTLINAAEAQVGNEAKMLKRQQTVRTFCGSTPIVTLKGGILTDQQKRTGNIVANTQFQFDSPLQDNALFTSGFSICQNNTLAYPGSAIFYQCLSGNPNDPENRSKLFNNLYTQPQGPTSGQADQCDQIYIDIIGCEPTQDQTAQYGLDGSSGSSVSSVSSSAAPQSTSSASATSAEAAQTTTATPAAPETTAAAAPYPTANNGTSPAASGSSSPPAGTSTSAPEPFVPGSGAASLIIGGKLFALVAGIGAFAMF